MDKKYCAYICAGCGIGDALDLEALAEVVTGEMSMECKTSDCLCGAEGRGLIEKDIAERCEYCCRRCLFSPGNDSGI